MINLMINFRKHGIGIRRISFFSCCAFWAFLALNAIVCCGQATPALANPVIAAYQEAYAMNFQVYWRAEFPSGWYATFDGYPVAQIAPNRWVYGRVKGQGLIPTEVLVGAVVPMDVPELARMPASSYSSYSSWSTYAYKTKAFQSIARSGADNMGVLDDPLAYTPVAWKTGVAGLRIWLGNKWYNIVPTAGQSTLQALLVKHPYIVRTLRKKNEWTPFDTQDLADWAREWGYIWRGHISFASLTGYRDNSSNGASGNTGNMGNTSIRNSTGNTDGKEWDIGSENRSSSGGSGWDTGSGGSGSSGSGSGSGWNTGGNGGGGTGNNNEGGGWDK